jgi:hypothetical protein
MSDALPGFGIAYLRLFWEKYFACLGMSLRINRGYQNSTIDSIGRSFGWLRWGSWWWNNNDSTVEGFWNGTTAAGTQVSLSIPKKMGRPGGFMVPQTHWQVRFTGTVLPNQRPLV